MLNKLDILSGLDEVLLCTGYTVDGAPIRWPLTLEELERAQPVYERFPGWQRELTDVRRIEALPPEAARYVDAIEQLAGVPITLVSVGPERTQTILRDGKVPDGPGRGPVLRPAV